MPLPSVPGMDLCGVIDEAGADVPASAHLRVGERVVGVTRPGGTRGSYAELVSVPSESVAPAPVTLSDAQAASFVMNALTAWGSLRALDLHPGQTLAVTGAAGALGGYLVQPAHRQGVRVLASASAADEDLVRGFGADAFVGRAEGVEGFREAAPEGVDVADAANLHAAMLPALTSGGRMAIYRHWGDDPVFIGIHVLYTTVVDQLSNADAIREIVTLAGEGELATRVADVLPMDDAAAAHHRLTPGHLRGRQILTLTTWHHTAPPCPRLMRTR
ncbi:MAG: zinc-binding dehydrogenase [Luteococcus sp.]|uniref:zinc-binding dehydrogenase n=1 Tax=Luteococcus sp. TaxID=1969402 RepID=UPI002648C23C|nr:zinc-binding dehydrogenase [Luteococcus sp.]MDN5562743.1 zinc-binding dehydrogenase [Luteococcus sp.]